MRRVLHSWRRLRNRIPVVGAALAALLLPTAPAGAVVGGAPADTTANPWVVSVRITQDGFEWNCAGALISSGQVMTAARCVSGFDPATIRVVAGQSDRTAGGGTEARIRKVWTHPGYSPGDGTPRNDLAVLTLTRDLPQTPIRIAPTIAIGGSPYAAGTPAVVLGWGSTDPDSFAYSTKLHGATLPVVANTDCAKQPGYVEGRTFCAGTPQGGADACFGDAGAPLVAKGMLIGIASYGFGCGAPGQYTLFTRTNAYPLSTDVRQPALPVVNQNSRKCLAIPSASTVQGTGAIQWDCAGIPDQQWSARPVPNSGNVEIVNLNSKLCLGVYGASETAGERAVQWECNGNADQQWTKRATSHRDGEAEYQLVNLRSGQCLAIQGAGKNNGENVIQWPCGENADHKWTW
ncbi:trypsin-like serine protease [Kitasatospora sp. NPDC094011]|uniref:trypsin-like serine protease n=1 Tax=Kitasatospora sp. NPDC094011 TaxID=3364090 RepID=UPI003814DC86